MVKSQYSGRKGYKKQLICKNCFQLAVESCTDIHTGYRHGLQALKKGETLKIEAEDTTALDGSVDIDSCLKKRYPEDSRWDYTVGYKGKAFFIEIHPAFTSEIATMIKKKEWLETWLKSEAKPLNEMRPNKQSIFWIFTDRCAILKNSPQYRKLVQHNLCPIAKLTLTDQSL